MGRAVVNSSAAKVARETAPGLTPPARASTSLTRTPFHVAVEIRSQPKGASSHLATKLLMHSSVLVTSTAGRRRRLARSSSTGRPTSPSTRRRHSAPSSTGSPPAFLVTM